MEEMRGKGSEMGNVEKYKRRFGRTGLEYFGDNGAVGKEGK